MFYPHCDIRIFDRSMSNSQRIQPALSLPNQLFRDYSGDGTADDWSWVTIYGYLHHNHWPSCLPYLLHLPEENSRAYQKSTLVKWPYHTRSSTKEFHQSTVRISTHRINAIRRRLLKIKTGINSQRIHHEKWNQQHHLPSCNQKNTQKRYYRQSQPGVNKIARRKNQINISQFPRENTSCLFPIPSTVRLFTEPNKGLDLVPVLRAEIVEAQEHARC